MDFSYSNKNFKINFVGSEPELKSCIQDLLLSPEFAFDLEFDKDRIRYGFTLCLIQLATKTSCYIIDPLARINLSLLFKLFENRSILKVAHASGEDLKLLQSLGCIPQNIFDTEIASRLLNYESTSLLSMLNVIMGFEHDKKMQPSNWYKRPLTAEQITYSSNDVIYLLDLKDRLQAAATEKGISHFLKEEFELLDSPPPLTAKRENFLKKSDLQTLSPYNQYVLNGLLQFRDALAKNINIPAAYLISNELMRDIALGRFDLNYFHEAKGIYRKFKSEQFTNELKRKVDQLHETATRNNLAKRNNYIKTTAEERLNRKEEMQRIRDAIFSPVQKKLEELYGINAGKYLLSDGLVNDLLEKKIKINDIKYRYRKEVVLAVARDLEINLQEYL